jgi:hypothetical protein
MGMPPQAGAAGGGAAAQLFPQGVTARLQQPALQSAIALGATKAVLEGEGYTILGWATQFGANPKVRAAAEQVCTATGHGYALLAARGPPLAYVCVAPEVDAVTGLAGDIKFSGAFV